MTPAVKLLKKNKINFTLHSYEHSQDCTCFGKEACQSLNLAPERVFKTLIINETGSKKNFFVCVIPVSSKLNLKSAAKAFHIKKAKLAQPEDAERITGYIVGGISPVSQKKSLGTIIDSSCKKFKSIFISAGKRGLQIEIAPDDLSKICKASFCEVTE